MQISGRGADVFRCNACGNVGIGHGEIICCDGPMRPVEGPEDPVEEPSLEALLQTVFDMSSTELDICLCVMEGGDQTVQELAESTDYDRSVVSRHLNHLVDLGVLEKQRRLLREGGFVYVYSPKGEDAVRRSLERRFLAWLKAAFGQLDALRRKKVEGIVETEGSTEWKIYREE